VTKSARLRFLREARAAASVRHPNVASVFHLGRTGSSYFYAIQSCFTVEIPGYLERGAFAVEPPFLAL
jgi:serine/threonine protein kinase